MLKVAVLSSAKTKEGKKAIPVVGELNMPLLAQVHHVYRDRSHKGTHKVKTRALVNRTKKKVYKQKGTGGARHGARSAPIYVGGGVAHGPKGIKQILSVSQKVRTKGLNSALVLKNNLGELFLVEDISKIGKTRDAAKILNIPSGKKLVVLSDKNFGKRLYLRNLKDTEVVLWKDLNAFQALTTKLIILDERIFEKERKGKSS